MSKTTKAPAPGEFARERAAKIHRHYGPAFRGIWARGYEAFFTLAGGSSTFEANPYAQSRRGFGAAARNSWLAGFRAANDDVDRAMRKLGRRERDQAAAPIFAALSIDERRKLVEPAPLEPRQ